MLIPACSFCYSCCFPEIFPD
uniref:Uncharacterized protein n=1 Tax=Arundo donax TaxID=35708 RepID=A0A0A9C4Y7_ARUDO